MNLITLLLQPPLRERESFETETERMMTTKETQEQRREEREGGKGQKEELMPRTPKGLGKQR